MMAWIDIHPHTRTWMSGGMFAHAIEFVAALFFFATCPGAVFGGRASLSIAASALGVLAIVAAIGAFAGGSGYALLVLALALVPFAVTAQALPAAGRREQRETVTD